MSDGTIFDIDSDIDSDEIIFDADSCNQTEQYITHKSDHNDDRAEPNQCDEQSTHATEESSRLLQNSPVNGMIYIYSDLTQRFMISDVPQHIVKVNHGGHWIYITPKLCASFSAHNPDATIRNIHRVLNMPNTGDDFYAVDFTRLLQVVLSNLDADYIQPRSGWLPDWCDCFGWW